MGQPVQPVYNTLPEQLRVAIETPVIDFNDYNHLTQSLGNNCQQAFNYLYGLHGQLIYNQVLFFTTDAAIVETLMTNTFTFICKNIQAGYKEEYGPLQNWLAKVCRSICYNYYQLQSEDVQVQKFSRPYRALQKLPLRLRHIFIEGYFKGTGLQVISQQTQLALQQVKLNFKEAVCRFFAA